MGLIDDKREIFNSIGAFTSLSEQEDLPKRDDSLSSVNNSNDASSFMIDILKVTVGSVALKQLTGKLLTSFIDSTEPILKSSLKNRYKSSNSSLQLPNQFKNGIEIPAKNIDVRNKFKSNPNSSAGDLLYSNSSNNFDNAAYDAIVNDGTEVSHNNLNIEYNADTENFKFSPVNEDVSIDDWFNDYIDNTEIIDKKEFISKSLNSMFGSISSNENKTVEQIRNELEYDELLKKIIDGEDDLSINEDVLSDIHNQANNVKNGVIQYDMGCGFYNMSLPLSNMSDLVKNISGSTDPNEVSNLIEDSVVNNASGENNMLENNKESVKDSFFSRLISVIKRMFVDSIVLSPQARMLQGVFSAINNDGNVDISNPSEDLKNNKQFITCLTKDVTNIINEFIFGLVKASLISLISPIIRKIVMEKINQYINIIKSLIT
ncbi:MAG: hypothetical protein ACOC2W_00895 [bacterium]